jgi:NTP pyrophosphatase (non-canonical NTP hydrolase)
MEAKDGIKAFLERTKRITLVDLASGHDVDYLFRNTVEEVGEFAAAVTIEAGIKDKPLKETSTQEAVDVVICALSLFYARGGTDEMLAEYGQKKLNKWEARLP